MTTGHFSFYVLTLGALGSLLVLRVSTHELEAIDKISTVQMGYADPNCDDARVNLTVDWDNSTDNEYACHEDTYPKSQAKAIALCEFKVSNSVDHICMMFQIKYLQKPPMSGSHRPLWPVYGEYRYMPEQRWVHGLEHGAVVLLYHPCADPEDIQILRETVTNCLRRHIITPYRHLSMERPLALVAWGCKMEIGYPDVNKAKEFIKSFANKNAPESRTWFEEPYGVYDIELTKRAETVSGLVDSLLCPEEEQNVVARSPADDTFIRYLKQLRKRIAVNRIF